MIQRARSDDVPQEIAARITGALSPWRIVLFGSRARGTARSHSDYDVFVEFDADKATLKSLNDQIRALFTGAPWTLDLKLQTRGTLERRRDDPGTIEWDVAREGRVLYADPAASIDIAPPKQVREPDPRPPESTHEWLESAERHLRHGRVLLDADDDFYPQICLASQQCAENFMKALLVSRHVRPDRTHDLSALLKALRDSSCPLPGLDADCEALTEHAITPRYPAGNNLGENDARLAFAAAERIVAAIRAELPPRLH
jgi:HEPN domain-containing protein/predicted nucleotidyltransferase